MTDQPTPTLDPTPGPGAFPSARRFPWLKALPPSPLPFLPQTAYPRPQTMREDSTSTATSAPGRTPADTVQDAYVKMAAAAAAPEAKSIGWEVLVGPLLEAAIQAVTGCIRSREQLAAGLANPGPLERAALRRAVRAEAAAQGQRPTPAAVNAAVEAALKIAREATPEQRRNFVAAVGAYAPPDNSAL
jgi:hypothetical protein